MMQEFVQQMKGTIQEFTDGVHTALPGAILSFDPAKCEALVSLSGQYNKPDGTKLAYPPVAHVPVVFPQVSGQQITIAFPIKPGDGCMVIFAEQALAAWRAGGESNLDLKHDLSNAIAIPGLFSTPNAVMQEAVAQDAVMIVNQQTKIIVKNSQVEIECEEMKINAKKVYISGEVIIDQELTVQGIKFTPHKHSEVQSGSDDSGSPKKG